MNNVKKYKFVSSVAIAIAVVLVRKNDSITSPLAHSVNLHLQAFQADLKGQERQVQ